MSFNASCWCNCELSYSLFNLITPTDKLSLRKCITSLSHTTYRNHWRLQHYHAPNDSPTTKDASFHVKSIRKFVCKLRSRAYVIASLIVRKYMYVRQQTYDCSTHETTTRLPTMINEKLRIVHGFISV